ncbi:GNAT family N-acetyltransferase [Tatumella sp. UBA2305]|uniref:GNAT family N-acetyltransferase n=1 Tax=Tatumella sp. UBA2305 TaxID=1947647 RepID=UPI0025F5C342|nr:GNAT family protein [Tatumella sp. UBA2305]
MSDRINQYGQPIGQIIDGWQPRPLPSRVTLAGQYCQLQPLDADRHTQELYQAFHCSDDSDSLWTYLAAGPFDSFEPFQQFIANAARSQDPLHFAVTDNKTGKAIGSLSLMRADAGNGVVEVGHVMFSPRLQRTPLSTEAQCLLMKHVFETLGYRRYEWKCDHLNAPSRKAASRLGFSFEGIFRQAVVYKGRSRDTAWYSIIDSEWQRLSPAFNSWLATHNFDSQGRQRYLLSHFQSAVL